MLGAARAISNIIVVIIGVMIVDMIIDHRHHNHRQRTEIGDWSVSIVILIIINWLVVRNAVSILAQSMFAPAFSFRTSWLRHLPRRVAMSNQAPELQNRAPLLRAWWTTMSSRQSSDNAHRFLQSSRRSSHKCPKEVSATECWMP